MKRWIGAGLALLLGGAVAAAIILGNRGNQDKPPALTTLHGVIGSEKQPFFADPTVKALFAKHGLRVEVDTAGSREIATSVDLKAYDFAFPSSAPAAEKIKQSRAGTVYSPFYSPMAVATFQPIVDLLAKAGLVADSGQGYQVLDLRKYLDLVAKGTRWDALPGNTAYPARKRILLTTTDIRTSNSAAMYLAMTSYVANGEDVVTSKEQAEKVAATLAPLFLDQGYSESSTEGPFEDYLALGMGKTPMVVAYEAQYVSHLIAGDGAIRPEMRLIYPQPTVLSKHTLVAFTSTAGDVGRLLTSDPEFVKLEARYGFRTSDPKAFTAAAGKNAPPTVIDVVEPPAFDHLENLIDLVQRRYLSAPRS